jgi:hypothetical protein
MLLRINEDSQVLSEAKDVLDEITMIQGVLQTQESVLGDHDAELVHLLGTWTDRLPLYNELRRMLGNFDQMKQRAQSVVDSVCCFTHAHFNHEVRLTGNRWRSFWI